MPRRSDPSTAPTRDNRLRALHPDARRRRARRRRWLGVALAALLSGALFVAVSAAHQAALRATADSDPALGTWLLAMVVFGLSLGLLLVLLGRALYAEIVRRKR